VQEYKSVFLRLRRNLVKDISMIAVTGLTALRRKPRNIRIKRSFTGDYGPAGGESACSRITSGWGLSFSVARLPLAISGNTAIRTDSTQKIFFIKFSIGSLYYAFVTLSVQSRILFISRSFPR
jgi:hypothetical protein